MFFEVSKHLVGGGVLYGIQKIKGFANNLGCSFYVYRLVEGFIITENHLFPVPHFVFLT